MNSNVVGHPALIEATRGLRGAGQRPADAPAGQRASEASLLRRLEALTQRDKELRVENLRSATTPRSGPWPTSWWHVAGS